MSEKILAEEFHWRHYAKNQHVFDDNRPDGSEPVSIPVRVDSALKNPLNDNIGFSSGIKRGKNP